MTSRKRLLHSLQPAALRAGAFCAAWGWGGVLACARASEPEATPAATPAPAVPSAPPAPPVPAPAAPANAAQAGSATASVDASIPIWGVKEFREHRGLAASTPIRLRGRVLLLRECPPCPAGAECKPCWESLDIGESADSPLGQSVAVELIQPTNAPPLPSIHVFQVGEQLVFSGTLRHWAEPSELPFAYIAYTGHVPAP